MSDDERLNVDLSADAPAAEGATCETNSAENLAREQATNGDTSERAKQEAQRYLADADGDTPAARAKNARQQLQQQATQTSQQLQQVTQQHDQKQARREKLADTRERVENQPADCQVLQTLGGGITLEVPPAEVTTQTADQETVVTADHADDYTRDDLVDDIAETRETLADQCEQLAEQVEQLEAIVETAQAADEHLAEYQQMSDGLDASQP